jgi:hypothetical protein
MMTTLTNHSIKIILSALLSCTTYKDYESHRWEMVKHQNYDEELVKEAIKIIYDNSKL